MSGLHPDRLVVLPDGSHVAVCSCGQESPVPVTHEPNEDAPFVLARDADGKPTEVVYGETAIFDFSEHEAHYREAH